MPLWQYQTLTEPISVASSPPPPITIYVAPVITTILRKSVAVIADNTQTSIIIPSPVQLDQWYPSTQAPIFKVNFGQYLFASPNVFVFTPNIVTKGAAAVVTHFYVRMATPRPQMPIAYLRQVNYYNCSVDPTPEVGLNTTHVAESPSNQPPYNQ